jgi:hypothetical protein
VAILVCVVGTHSKTYNPSLPALQNIFAQATASAARAQETSFKIVQLIAMKKGGVTEIVKSVYVV